MTIALPDAKFVASEVEPLLRKKLESATSKVERVGFGNIEFAREDIYHQRIEVVLSTNGQRSQIFFWLKHRQGINQLFPILSALKKIDSAIPFPDPIVSWTKSDGSSSALVTSFVRGTLLRDAVAKSAVNRVLRRKLFDVFAANGVAMARFHNASTVEGSISAKSYISRIAVLVEENNRLGGANKSAIAAQLNRASTILGDKQLQLTRIHHDWTLRNILLDEGFGIHVVDFDSMLAPFDVAIVDVGCFLLNLESQLKWWPVARRRVLRPYWQAFRDAYQNNRSHAGQLDATALEAMLYCIRVSYVVGGYFRVPLHEKFSSPMGQYFISKLTRNLMAGHSNLLECA